MENKEPTLAPRKGVIKFVNLNARFGFIIDLETREEFYFKTGDWAYGGIDTTNRVYLFEITQRKRGPQAINIRPAQE
jgi:cold shock CspA family protein